MPAARCASRAGGRNEEFEIILAKAGVTIEGGVLMQPEMTELVDADRGLINHRIFIEPEIYRQELEQIFARCWLYLCHDSQITLPGDFLTTYIGKVPVMAGGG